MSKFLQLTVIYTILAGFSIQAEMHWNFPGYVDGWHSYTDASSGGNSESYKVKFSDSIIEWSFQLRNHNCNIWPFTGISRTVPFSERKEIEDSDSLIIVICSDHQVRINLNLSTYDPEITKPEVIQSWRTLEYPILINQQKQRFSIPLKNFKVSEWWKKKYKIAPEDNKLFLESIGRIALTAKDPQYCDHTYTIFMYGLSIKHRNHFLLTCVVLTLILFIPGLIILIILKKNNKPDNSRFDSIQIKPRPVPGPPSEWERVLEYLQVNYTDPQLNLQQLAINIGISDSKLSRLINERYHDGFRYLVHEFRINEGKRLLKESEMNISEIAYKLGYATSNHFNREFKKRTLLSPSSFRKSVSKENNDEII